MHRYLKLLFRTLAIVLILITGGAFIIASGGSEDDNASGGGGDGGSGAVSFPAGIQIRSIIGDQYLYGGKCSVDGNGTRGAYFIYTTLVNTTSAAIEVTIPAGVLLDPEPHPHTNPQQMLVTQDTSFFVETGAHGFCVWVNCSGGGGKLPREDFHYTFGAFVENACQWEVIGLLRGKNLPAMQRYEVFKIFHIIRNCPSHGLSDEEREFFRSLP